MNFKNQCMYCGKQLDSSGKCDCWQSQKYINVNNEHNTNQLLEAIQSVFSEKNVSNYAYKCPGCSGEFVFPIYDYATKKYYCPFCSYLMKGMTGDS